MELQTIHARTPINYIKRFRFLQAYTLFQTTEAGKRGTLIEGRAVLSGVTGHTNAKIAAQHARTYDEMIQAFVKEKVRLYYAVYMHVLHLIKEVVAELNIDCDLEPKKAVMYATSEKGVQKIRAYEQLEIQGRFSIGPLQYLFFETLAAFSGLPVPRLPI